MSTLARTVGAATQISGNGDVSEIRVLIVEDTDSDAALFTAYLSSQGTDFKVTCATTLELGKQKLRTSTVDAVLLDLHLPDATGLATFEALYAEFPELPIVVLTGLNDHEVTTQALRAGAQDYLAKEKADGDVLSRAIRYAIERCQRQKAEQRVQVNEQEFDVARRIQRDLLPKVPPTLTGFDVAGDCRPAAATGGDYFDYVPMTDGRIGVVVADVSTHGFAPALIMAGTRRVLRTMVRHGKDLDEILAEANLSVYEDTKANRFVTMFFAQIDPVERALTYHGAGHDAYLLDVNSDETIALPSTTYPLGVLPDYEKNSGIRRELKSGQLLLITSDGFREAQAPDGQLFGMERVLDVVRGSTRNSAQDIVDGLFAAVDDFQGEQTLQDDITAVIVKAE